MLLFLTSMDAPFTPWIILAAIPELILAGIIVAVIYHTTRGKSPD